MAAAGSPRLERWFRTPDGCFCGELFDKDGVPDGAVWKTSPCLALDAELLGYVTTRSSNEVFQLGERGRTIEVEFLGAQCPRGEWRYSINVFVDGVCSPIWRCTCLCLGAGTVRCTFRQHRAPRVVGVEEGGTSVTPGAGLDWIGLNSTIPSDQSSTCQ